MAATTGEIPADPQLPLEVDEDAASIVESDTNSSTASVASSILDYRILHGRRYHSEMGNAAYWGSNDERQIESMDLNHHALTIAIGGKLYLAPLEVEKVKRVLDLGTGSGIWAIDFADEHPEVEVIGTDVSPIQPTWAPPNLKFEVEDYTREWTFGADSFDFVHMRWLTGSIPDWDAHFQEAYKALKPGGWVQSYEPSSSYRSDHVEITEDTALWKWGGYFAVQGSKLLGRSFKAVEDNLPRRAMEAAGFVDINEHFFKNPMGSWPKEKTLKQVGAVTQQGFEMDIEGYVNLIASKSGWTQEEIQVYIAQLRNEIRSLKYRPYYFQRIIWGRKPQ